MPPLDKSKRLKENGLYWTCEPFKDDPIEYVRMPYKVQVQFHHDDGLNGPFYAFIGNSPNANGCTNQLQFFKTRKAANKKYVHAVRHLISNYHITIDLLLRNVQEIIDDK